VCSVCIVKKQVQVVKNAITIASQGIDSSINIQNVEIWNFNNDKQLGLLTSSGVRTVSFILCLQLLTSIEKNTPGKCLLSVSLLDLAQVHNTHNRCLSANLSDWNWNTTSAKGSSLSCSCREVRILMTIINCKATMRTSQPHESRAFESIMTERLLQQLVHTMLAISK
jgi:hypothetical protein